MIDNLLQLDRRDMFAGQAMLFEWIGQARLWNDWVTSTSNVLVFPADVNYLADISKQNDANEVGNAVTSTQADIDNADLEQSNMYQTASCW